MLDPTESDPQGSKRDPSRSLQTSETPNLQVQFPCFD